VLLHKIRGYLKIRRLTFAAQLKAYDTVENNLCLCIFEFVFNEPVNPGLGNWSLAFLAAALGKV
jgi:hypothetical protein